MVPTKVTQLGGIQNSQEMYQARFFLAASPLFRGGSAAKLWCQQQGPGWHQSFTHIEHRASVTVIWASTRFGHPHSQTPSDMRILSDRSPNLNPNR